MPLNAPSPLEAFQMGTARGAANSPVTGIGLAIENVVKQANAKGLLRAQSQFQSEGADRNAILKEGRAEERLDLPKPTSTIGVGGTVTPIKIDGEDPTARHEFIKEPSKPFNLLEMLMGGGQLEDLLKDAGIGGEGGNQNIVNEETAAIEALKAAGADVTPANIAEAIRQLKGK